MDVKQFLSTKVCTKAEDKLKKGTEAKYNDEENKCIVDLKKLYLDTIKLDASLQKDIYNLEKSYEAQHEAIYDKRLKILDDYRKKAQGGDSGEGNLDSFWMKVLKTSYTEFISKQDEKMLVFLTDIRSKLYNDPVVKFVLEFYFAPNEYFSDKVLTKTYFLNCLPDKEDPLSYDGAEIFKCEGCKINWKQTVKTDNKKPYSSFFDFFNPPTLPEKPDDTNYCEINAILQNDFELGFYLKERVIPKAVLFFTGELTDFQSSESDSDSEDDDDDEDEDEDEGGGGGGGGGVNPAPPPII